MSPITLINKKFFNSFFFILNIILFSQANSNTNNQDYGIISLMYHRFEENKYPSTNIRINDFIEQIKIIEEEGIKFVNPKNFKQELRDNLNQRKVLITIDDGFLSFMRRLGQFLNQKKNSIHFIC